MSLSDALDGLLAVGLTIGVALIALVAVQINAEDRKDRDKNDRERRK